MLQTAEFRVLDRNKDFAWNNKIWYPSNISVVMYLYWEIALSLRNAESFIVALEIKESMQEVI